MDLKQEVKEKMLDEAKRELCKQELWVEFYNEVLKGIKNKEEKAKHQLKIEGIMKGMETNKAVIIFLSK